MDEGVLLDVRAVAVGVEYYYYLGPQCPSLFSQHLQYRIQYWASIQRWHQETHSKVQLICVMIRSHEVLTISQIADAAECSQYSIYHISDSVRAPLIRARRRRIISPSILVAFREHLTAGQGQ